MNGIGLVFAGGGGKGAYEIGVWKYLHEIGLDKYVRVISGTSVGALNAALFVGSDYGKAEKLWLDVKPSKILTPRKFTIEEIASWLGKSGVSLAAINSISPMISGALTGIQFFRNTLFTSIVGDHVFSREGLIEMIYEGLDFRKLQHSEIPCYVTCTRCPELQIERFKLNDYGEADITKLLLASSAIPVVFPSEKFNGKQYCDGGIPVFGDNVPLEPVYKHGIDLIVVVYLNQTSFIDKTKYPNSKIIEIVPTKDLGDAINGTMDFSPEGAKRRLDWGYTDTKQVMKPILEMMALHVENERILKCAMQKQNEFERKRETLLKEEKRIKEEMRQDGFDELYNKLMRD